MLREAGMDIAFRERTFATVDHIVPTDLRKRPFLDPEAEELTQVLEKNVAQFGVEFFGLESMRFWSFTSHCCRRFLSPRWLPALPVGFSIS